MYPLLYHNPMNISVDRLNYASPSLWWSHIGFHWFAGVGVGIGVVLCDTLQTRFQKSIWPSIIKLTHMGPWGCPITLSTFGSRNLILKVTRGHCL